MKIKRHFGIKHARLIFRLQHFSLAYPTMKKLKNLVQRFRCGVNGGTRQPIDEISIEVLACLDQNSKHIQPYGSKINN